MSQVKRDSSGHFLRRVRRLAVAGAFAIGFGAAGGAGAAESGPFDDNRVGVELQRSTLSSEDYFGYGAYGGLAFGRYFSGEMGIANGTYKLYRRDGEMRDYDASYFWGTGMFYPLAFERFRAGVGAGFFQISGNGEFYRNGSMYEHGHVADDASRLFGEMSVAVLPSVITTLQYTKQTTECCGTRHFREVRLAFKPNDNVSFHVQTSPDHPGEPRLVTVGVVLYPVKAIQEARRNERCRYC